MCVSVCQCVNPILLTYITTQFTCIPVHQCGVVYVERNKRTIGHIVRSNENGHEQCSTDAKCKEDVILCDHLIVVVVVNETLFDLSLFDLVVFPSMETWINRRINPQIKEQKLAAFNQEKEPNTQENTRNKVHTHHGLRWWINCEPT